MENRKIEKVTEEIRGYVKLGDSNTIWGGNKWD